MARPIAAAAAEAVGAAGLPTADEEVWRYSRIGELDLERYAPLPASAARRPPGSRAGAARCSTPWASAPAIVVLCNGRRARDLPRPAVGRPGRLRSVGSSMLDARRGHARQRRRDARSTSSAAQRRVRARPVLVRVPRGVIVDRADRGRPLDRHRRHRHVRPARRAGRREQPGRRRRLRGQRRRRRRSAAPVVELDVGPAAPRRLPQRPGPRRSRPGTSPARCRRSTATPRSSPPQAALGGDYARTRTDCRLVGRGATGNLRRRVLRRGRPDARLPHVPGPPRARHHERPAVQGRGRRPVPLGLHRAHPRAARRRGAPTPSRPTATSSCPTTRGPSRCPTSRSRTTTCAAATRRPSGPIDEDQRFYLESRGVPPDGGRAAHRRRLLRRGARTAAGRGRAPSRCEPRLVERRQRRGGADEHRGAAAAPSTTSRPARRGASTSARSASPGAHRRRLLRHRRRCTHQDFSLSEGEVDEDEREIECWKHGSTFSLETGEPQSLPATKPVPVYDVRVDGDDVLTWCCHERARRSTACAHRCRARRSSRGVDLVVRSGEVHAVMGPNGSGKSTLSHVLMGEPGYEVTGGSVTLDGVDLLGLPPWERARAGLFLAMQYPTEVPGVSLDDVLVESALAAGRDAPVVASAESPTRRTRIGFDERVPRPPAQRRPLRRREEAQRDAAARRARSPRSPSSTSSTRASTSTPCGP